MTAQSEIPPGIMDNLGRDRFELLSAYLDGEVTAEERRLVQQWLDSDPLVQRLYVRLLRVHHGIQNLPPYQPQPALAAPDLAAAVFAKVDRRSRRRQVELFGGAAIAAVVLGAISLLLPDRPVPQVVTFPSEETEPSALMIAINQPAIDIPVAALPSTAEEAINKEELPSP